MAIIAQCDCGGSLTFDPERAGETCGGLSVVGAHACATCGQAYIGAGTIPAESATWSLAKGGRSVDAGKLRIRAEGGGDAEGIMRRIARLPELERALKRIAAGEREPASIAKAAMAMLDEAPAPEPEAA